MPFRRKQSPSAEPKKRSRNKVVFGVFAGLILLVGTAGYLVTKIITGPSVGTVVQTIPVNNREEQVELKQFDGTHFSFAHPITYIEQTVRRQPSPNELESHIFVSSGMVSRVLTTIVSKLPTGQVQDDPSYSMRLQDKAKYQLQEIIVKNEKVSIFTSNDTQQIQQTAFWPHKDKLLTFTMSGVATNVETAKAEYESMVTTLGWR
jgi:sucrose-6-phosphate hydrolase SacC (GH32 family)